MAGKSDIIGVIEGDVKSAHDYEPIKNKSITWHLIGGANTDHETLCGIDATDTAVGFFGTAASKRGQKVTCRQCINEFNHVKALKVTARDFEI